ncbi:hypothetical protein NGRA_2333 [Nosema granulosis]|uniref:Uncharacterized protein n=1 Tax=Nosema granulosis TaxID=83296 RepID=A0A9P6GWV9_9MICR|nr:hypothetical protein NGRA_2333 [Nosema granulosis]
MTLKTQTILCFLYFNKNCHSPTLLKIYINNFILFNPNLQTVELEKARKYDLLAIEVGLMYKCKVRIIPYVMHWYGCVTTYHRKYVRSLNLSASTETYIQSRVLKKTLESISFEHRQGHQEGGSAIREADETARRLVGEKTTSKEGMLCSTAN